MTKKITLLALFLTTTLSFSQATLEHSYAINQDEGGDQSYFFNTETASYHYTFDTSNVLKIYTETHSVYKTVNLPVDTGYIINNMYLFTDKLFNSDNLIEFLLVTRSPTGTHKMTLVNENGVVLQQFGDKQDALIVKTLSNNYKLITQKAFYESDIYTTTKDVYSLTGTLSVNQTNKLSKASVAYPNPVKDILSITNPSDKTENSSLKVYAVSGKLVLQKNISNDAQDFIKLDVSGLQPGVYIYKINEVSNKFIKE
ncbi:T9SS type A sorting domain-containing protein [Flavobacterium sp.]|uniref:T9SS type A sorting domain-containing protein n=1 Tax=Flavobacterium sp. TaxID=239 RepID=UPI003D12F15A